MPHSGYTPPMADSRKAVFLSYASQDAEAARRLSEAMQAVGLEVWFDKDELRGGEAWDASIRRQIKECALFVPIVSANTESRAEGYFRLEWKLAVDRSHLMADDRPFLVPLAIDATPEATARVPDRFRDVQWSRLGTAETERSFAERVARVLASDGRRTPAPEARPAAPTAAMGSGPSIAVLPFVNMSRDEENEYFADGLSEELLNVLAKIRGLRVASRTSAFFFKGKTMDIPSVAQKLGVATILEGSVRKSGKRVRITAQLIDVASDSHLWSSTYDRELDDIFTVQDDIAQSVVTELRQALLGERTGAALRAAARAEVQAAAAGRTDNPESHRLYLQGRFFLERTTEADTARAVELFRNAISLDPGFALGWAGLSHAQALQAGHGWSNIEEGYKAAREAAVRALGLAPDLAEAHTALGGVLMSHDWKWKEALESLKRAYELAPGNVSVLRSYSGVIARMGRNEEALVLLRKAAALDPLSAATQRMLGMHCAIYHRYDEAEQALHRAIELNPTAGLVHCFLSIVWLMRGNAAKALEVAQKEPNREFALFGIALAEHSLGHRAESDKALEELIQDFGRVSGYQIAEACAWRGERDRAFEWLERAYSDRDPGLSNLAIDNLLNSLRDDARWPAFMKKMGFA
jgi:TolB-like protein/Tfp pilus assembly protein PilF